jgi:putative ABC transport system permease protein
MKTWDLIKTSNRNLFRNKLRTILTVLAIFVGSFTLTMTNGVGDGMRDYVESQVKNIESDRVILVRRKVELPSGADNDSGPQEYKESTGNEEELGFDPNSILLTTAQIENSVREIEGVRSVTPRYTFNAEYISVDGSKKYKAVMGTLSDGVTAKTDAGTALNGPGQIVIPSSLAKALDPQIANLVGKTATVGYKAGDGEMRTIDLKVVGVATKGFITNENAFIDTATARTLYTAQRSDSGPERFIGYSVQMESNDAAKIERAKAVLSERGFEASTFADNAQRTYDAIQIFKTAMNLFAMVALLAASFGIINTLVIAVLERTKEIGLQKALGMGRGKIFAIFSLESVLIGFWGAVLGAGAAIVTGLVANQAFIKFYARSFEGFSLFAFKPLSIAAIMLLVCGIAFVAGVMPAIRASRLNPIESLRYE